MEGQKFTRLKERRNMAVRNVPQRSGRIRGHEALPTRQGAKFVVEEMHRPSRKNAGSRSAADATAAGSRRARRVTLAFKAPQTGGEGRTARLQARTSFRQNKS